MADSSPDWWKDLPCHLCQEWNLKGEIHLDIRKLKQSIDWDLEDDHEFMPIENLLYRAFLEVPPENFLMRERSSPKCALERLQEAEDKVAEMWKDNEEVQNSYKLMINAFRMWLYNDGRFIEISKRAVLDKNPANTNFPIHNKSAKKNTSVDAKFDGYLGKYFSGANPPVPKHIRDYLIAIQPMVSDDNGWLNAPAGFVNDAKHKGSDCGPTYQFCDEARFKKEDLVRISCCRVEEISVTLLEYVEDLYNKGLTRPGFLHETDRQTV